MNRSRNSTITTPCDNTFSQVDSWKFCNFPNQGTTTLNGVIGPTYTTKRTGTIVDELGVSMAHRQRRKPRYIRSVSSEDGMKIYDRVPPIKSCTDTKVSYELTKPIDISWIKTDFAGNYNSCKTHSVKLKCRSSEVFSRYVLGLAGATQLFLDVRNTVGNAPLPDWFSLVDRFNERTTQYTENNMLLGETIAEGGIYKDIFKAIVNPSSAFSSMLKHVTSLRDLAKGHTLGTLIRKDKRSRFVRDGKQVGAAVLHDASNNFLGYSFALQPVVEDVRAMLNAHRMVTKRLAYLQKHGGSWSRLGVKQKFILPRSDYSIPTGSNSAAFATYDDCQYEAGISGYAQIRSNLAGDAGWQAYYQYFGLNKILGLAWELVPFSFVLDWVTSAQECVNYYTRLETGSPYVGLAGVCHFTKQSLGQTARLKSGWMPGIGAGTSSALDGLELGSRKIVSYARRPGFPQTAAVIDFSNLGTFHAAASGALIVQGAPKTFLKQIVSPFRR